MFGNESGRLVFTWTNYSPSKELTIKEVRLQILALSSKEREKEKRKMLSCSTSKEKKKIIKFFSEIEKIKRKEKRG